MWLTIGEMNNLSGWLCWDDGCRMWLCNRHIPLRLFVKMCVYCVCSCVSWIAIRMVFSSPLRMFCRHGSLFAIQRLLAGQYTPEPAVLPTLFSFGGDK